MFICEEAGAVANDPVVGADFVELVERGRSAGVFSVVSAQDPFGLGDERVRSALMSNAATVSYGQPLHADLVTPLAGTRSVEQASVRYDGWGVGSGGTTTRQLVPKMPEQLLREFGTGELMVAYRGRFATAAAARAAASYALPVPPEQPSDGVTPEVAERPLAASRPARLQTPELVPARAWDGREQPSGAPAFLPPP